MRRAFCKVVASLGLVVSSASCVIVDPGCGAGGASILISPTVVFVAVGQSATPRASWCRNGRYDPMSPHWSLGSADDATVIDLDPETGRITGRRAGRATVIATSEGAGGASVSVTVE
ncbi:MAG TPA: Ig-like domain-containing protein [Gemmatimonadaceae bacterium]|nr:Ig-like domain-containing protein [Gemmatimonadaceae bacterium]